MPSYQTFNYRLNLMPEAISELVRQLIHSFKPQDCDSMKSLVDSMPIITCAGKNKVGKVATEITSKGYCSTKKILQVIITVVTSIVSALGVTSCMAHI